LRGVGPSVFRFLLIPVHLTCYHVHHILLLLAPPRFQFQKYVFEGSQASMMLAMEEVLCELSDHEKKNEQGLPPGFRFHPTDEELITFYLASKVFKNTYFNNVKFAEVDLNRCEPWELPGIIIYFLNFLLTVTPT